jgi:RimJ/RimL family protein N-acetyltransferase
VYVGDECLGAQTVLAEDFAVLRTVETGSWLGRAHQGRGFGKEMRAATLHFAFECLGATHAVTGAFEDNAASLGVTRSLGYRPNGERLCVRRGSVARELRFVLDAEGWSAATARLGPTEASGITPDLLAQLGVPTD